MHSAVMQNADYIKFASQNTVEVLALGRLDEGVQKQDKKAATYKGVRDGQEVDLMVEWPNLTFEEIIALNQSPAGQFNKTGGIPYTSIVNPHDQTEMWSHSGGTGASAIEEAATAAKKKLEKQYGKGIARKELKAFSEAESQATKLTADGEFAKAIAAIDAFKSKRDAWPQDLQVRYDADRQAVIDAAQKRLDEIEEAGASDPVAAKRDLDRLMLKLAKTGLEARAKELAQELATGG